MKARLGNYISEYSVRNHAGENIPVYSVTNTDGFCTGYFDKDVSSKDKSTYKIVPKGFFAYNPSRINVGSIDWLRYRDRVIVSPLYVVFSVSDRLLPQYLYYYLKSNVGLNYICATSQGSVRNNLKFSMLQDFPIEIRTIEDQKVVISILDKIKNLCLLQKKILEQYDNLIKARFVEMFGDLDAGTNKYQTMRLSDLVNKISQTMRLSDLVNKISDGVHSKPNYTETGRPFLSVVNINKGKVDFSGCKFVSEDAYQKMIRSTYPQKGDILYTKVGATYGIPAYVDTEIEFCLYVSVCLIKPKHDMINSRFLAIQMSLPMIKHQADLRIKGIGVPDLHLNQISEFNIICPPRELQDSFVDFVNQIDKSKFSKIA